MKNHFHNRNFKFVSVLLIVVWITMVSCSFKTIVHPYPQQFNENPDDYVDNIILHKTNRFEYLPNDSEMPIDLNYKEGSLFVDDGWSPILEKKDKFENPITSEEYEIISKAYYDTEKKEDVFEVQILRSDSHSEILYVSGISESATIIDSRSESHYIKVLNMWAPSISKNKGENGTEWHHYPLGGMWEFTDSKVNKFNILQGSPVTKKFGSLTHFGESFTFLFEEKIQESRKAELINTFMGYWNLTNIQYYYEECEYEEPTSDACPGSVIIN